MQAEIRLLEALVSDISVLKGMLIHCAECDDCEKLVDLSPLAECRTLSRLSLPPNYGNIDFVRNMPELTLRLSGESRYLGVEEFLDKHPIQELAKAPQE